MLGPRLLPLTSYKKDYSFSWILTDNPNNLDVGGVSGKLNAINNIISKVQTILTHGSNYTADVELLTLLLPKTLPYVSSFAKQVSLPDDEMELKPVEIGPYTFYTPKKKKMSDISVTYYDDSYANVYRFHKIWQEMIIKNNEMTTMEPVYKFTVGGIYSYVEKDLGPEEQIYTMVADSLGLSTNQATSQIERIFPELDSELGTKTISNYYPRLYPRSIKRSEGNRDGSGLATVGVTYCRMPEIGKSSLSEVTYSNERGNLEGTPSPILPKLGWDGMTNVLANPVSDIWK